MLWRACSREALKRKQRQGTPASWAHLTYLGPGKGSLVRGPGATPRRAPAHPYLARLWTSGFVLSITTRFLCLRAASHAVTQRCHEPRVSWGGEGSQAGRRPGDGDWGGQRERHWGAGRRGRPRKRTEMQEERKPGWGHGPTGGRQGAGREAGAGDRD